MENDNDTELSTIEAGATNSGLSLQTPYVYDPLPEDSTWIRLLELQPDSDHNAPIQGSLRTALLEADLSYEALSYCWGDPSVTEPVYLDGHSCAVTINLAEALRTLRLADRHRTIWVDAICINQTDIPEKNRQVGIMRDIYSGGSCTNVWLGPSDEHSRERFKRLGIRFSNFDFRFFYSELRDMNRERPRKATVDRPWTSRIWVVQEIAASRAITVHCGSDRCSWKDFKAFWNFSGLSELIDMHSLKLVSSMDAIKENFAKGDRFALHMALKVLRPFDATRPIDKVYALAGLLRRPADVTIDYRMDPQDLFRDIAMTVISQTSSLDILANALQAEQGPKLCGLMSWIPDWSDNSFVSPSSDLYERRAFWASNDTFSMPSLKPNNTLEVTAQFIALVEEVARPFPSFARYRTELFPPDRAIPKVRTLYRFVKVFIDTIEEWRGVARKTNHQCGSLGDPYITGQPLVEAFYCTVFRQYQPAICDHSRMWDNAIDALEMCWKILIWYRKYTMSLPLPLAVFVSHPIMGLVTIALLIEFRYIRGIKIPSVDVLLEAIFPDGTDQRAYASPLGRTSNGLLGLFPGPDFNVSHPLPTAPGDSVVLLQGASRPFVIRKVGAQWRLVGEAYIHGIMYGGAFKQDQCVSITLC